MRRIIVIVLSILFGLEIAQAEFLPFMKEGRKWIIEYVLMPYETKSYREICVQNSEIEDGVKVWHVVERDIEPAADGWIVIGDDINRKITEENGVVTIYNHHYDEWQVYLSLLLEEGERTGLGAIRLWWKTEMEVAGCKRLCQYFASSLGVDSWVVEGIGASTDVWNHSARPTGSYWEDDDYEEEFAFMLECWDGDDLTFTAEDFAKLMDQYKGVLGVNRVDNPAGSTDRIYDLYGRKVERPISGEIYIRDGRKIVF